jgi:hypothetical protein
MNGNPDACASCKGDGIKKPLEKLRGQTGAYKRCPDCRGTGVPRALVGPKWRRVRFRTPDGDTVTVRTRGKDGEDALLKARRLLAPGLRCEALD